MLCRIASAEPYQNPVLSSFSIVLDSKSHFFPSSGTFSGNVDLADSKSLMTKLTFSVVSCSVPSSNRGRSYSLPPILPTDFDKPTSSISLPIKVGKDINETTEFQKEKSCENTSARDPSNEFGNSKRESYKNTKDKEKKIERPKGILRNTEALGVETKFEILCGGNTSYLRGIYNDLANKDSATIFGRFCFEISIILVISGFLTLFLTFLPYQATSNAYHAHPVSIEEIFETLLSPYLSLKPPNNVI
ncbi:uncharacterized protein LOC143237660 [Tachypleus tridentatus]|uniref:uncharacterized protein LOC143237660 n=1 Tax=Tachypleus tridentatus TaxID=6853 RepID=UPI003FD6A7EA